jgi:hypothetical protein
MTSDFGKTRIVDDLPIGTILAVKTMNTEYIFQKRAEGVFVHGHPEYCPTPVPCRVAGSTVGGSTIFPGKIITGLNLEIAFSGKFCMVNITTSPIDRVTVNPQELDR